MKITEGTYARVKSDQELLMAVAYFISKGFELEENKIHLYDTWEIHNIEGFHACVVACADYKARFDYVESVKKEFENPVQVFLPSTGVIDRYAHIGN